MLDLARIFYFSVVYILFSLPLFSREYIPSDLSASDRLAIRGYSSYARARYLIAQRSDDIEQIAKHLRDCLLSLPEEQLPLRLLLFLRQGEGALESLLADLSVVVAANPEHARINVVYGECLAEARRHDEACRHLLAFIEKIGWRSTEAIISLLNIKCEQGVYSEAEEILLRALRKKELRNNTRLKIFHAHFILRRANAEKSSGDALLAARQKAEKLINPLVEKGEVLGNWEAFVATFPVLVELEKWDTMKSLLDAAPADFADTVFCYKSKLLALVKLDDISGLTRLSSEVFANSEINDSALEDLAQAFLDVNEITKAQEIYELLHLRNINLLHYRLQLAWIYLLRGADNKGLALLAPLKTLPFRGLLLKAGFLKQRKQYKQALEIYRQAEEMALASQEKPQLDSGFYLTYAFAAENGGEHALAIEKFRQAHKLHPDAPDLCNALGYTLADHGQELLFAEELIEKAVLAEADNIAFLDSLAWVRFRLKKHHGALRAILKTLAVFSPGLDQDGVIHQHAGDIFAANQYPILAELFKYKAKWEQTEK